MRLIDADALKVAHGMKDDCADCDKELRGKSRSCEFDRIYSLMDFCGWLDDAPTIEARKKGRWMYTVTHYPYCSECGWMPEEDEMRHMNYDFCPGCGSYNGEEGEE